MQNFHDAIDKNVDSQSGALIERHKVLRNTYMMLSLMMVPTVFGAWLAMAMNISKLLQGVGAGTMFLVFIAISWGLIYAIHKNKTTKTGVALLLGFAAFTGITISPLLSSVLQGENGAGIVMMAFSGTAMVMLGMSVLAHKIKRDLSFMGKFLFVGLIMLLVAMVGNMFLMSSALSITLSTISVGLFSAYMLYDIKNVLDGKETNYVTAALSIYLDLINVFMSLLNLLRR